MTRYQQKSKILKRYLFLILNVGLFYSFNGQIITTVAGNGAAGYSGDGMQATLSQLKLPGDVAIDGLGNFYIADYFNSRVRKVSTTGIITTVAGNGVGGYSGDGGNAAAAQINSPTGVALDGLGNIYIADTYGHRIRKVSSSGTITTIAGNGVMGYGGDGGLATSCSLSYPWEVKIDANGNIFIADYGNNRIRKIDVSGTITTIAGNGSAGFSGDGLAANLAQLNSPQGVALDATGNVYITDKFNNRIRKVNTSGIISTIAGNGVQGFGGDGMIATSASLYNPMGIAIDGAGNIYFADYLNNRIRMINSSGIINTVVGSGVPGYFGDGGLATSSQIYQAFGVGVDFSGNIWVADSYNHRIRQVSSVLDINELKRASDINIFPNPASDFINFELKTATQIKIINTVGEEIFNERLEIGNQKFDVSKYKSGIYFINVSEISSGKSAIKKLIVQ